jgi:hypothetical protein
MINFQTREALFKCWKNLLGIDLRQRPVEGKRAAFLKSLLMQLIKALLSMSRPKQEKRAEP